MRVMHISPAQFNMIVAAYAIAAGISGVAAARQEVNFKNAERS